ncbi:MAG TPA: ATP-binding protein [Thermoanaerobaculia bacterium]|nr:ATP-binding protein [Thermoanaerobaculia bacterium]
MIQLLQAKNFRMLRSNSVALQPYQVLVGQNATGKSTLLGALQLIGDVLRGGVHFAVEHMAPSFYDLCFDPSQPISLAVELSVPGPERRERRLRYEIEIGIDETHGLRVLHENLFILPKEENRENGIFQPSLFGEVPITVVHPRVPRHWRQVVSKKKEGRDYFRDEKTEWNNMFRFGLDRAALGSLPEDPDRFPLSIAARNALRDGLRTLQLDAAQMRSASPPGAPVKMALDGSNLPYVVRSLVEHDPILFAQWVKLVGTAVEGLESVNVRQREEDRYLVLEAKFQGQHQQPVPSWLLSDGTLRLMALTLINFAATENDLDAYLIEEPENGLHPLAIQVVNESLSNPPANAQVLCATHSPIFLAQTDLEHALVFRRASEGHAIVRRATEIPELREWTGRVNLSDLFVTGVLA